MAEGLQQTVFQAIRSKDFSYPGSDASTSKALRVGPLSAVMKSARSLESLASSTTNDTQLMDNSSLTTMPLEKKLSYSEKKQILQWITACRKGQLDKCEELLKEKIDLVDSYPPLSSYYRGIHIATLGNNEKLLKFLVEKGANINAVTLGGYTPLHLAAQNGLNAMIVALIELGADRKIYDFSGKTYEDYLGKSDSQKIAVRRRKAPGVKLRSRPTSLVSEDRNNPLRASTFRETFSQLLRIGNSTNA